MPVAPTPQAKIFRKKLCELGFNGYKNLKTSTAVHEILSKYSPNLLQILFKLTILLMRSTIRNCVSLNVKYMSSNL
jgi:hypothetical protein